MPLGQDVAQDMGIPQNYNSFQIDNVEEELTRQAPSRQKPPTGTYNVQISRFTVREQPDRGGHIMKKYYLEIVDEGPYANQYLWQNIWTPEDNFNGDGDSKLQNKIGMSRRRIAQLMKGVGLQKLSNLSELEGRYLQVDVVFDGNQNYEVKDVREVNMNQSLPETEAVVSDKIPF